ncbi:MAG: DUF790 family protein [Pirellulaceae bacterium]|nr:DUF790 family protein [Pirellulaceae bacterium]
MLTRQEALVDYDEASGRAIPDRLTREKHRSYLGYAQRFLDIYSAGIGRTRRELHRSVESALAANDDCPLRRIAAFKKLLDEKSKYAADAGRKAAKLRQQVFLSAATSHPLVSRVEGVFCNLEQDVKQRIAAELNLTWEQIDARLFSDVIEFQRLEGFEGYASPEALLARYNVAQTQAALYGAEQLMVWSQQDYKAILRYAKLARLMHSIRREGDGSYCFRFDGPASVLRRSTRYGVAMARFLPGLLSCGQWRATAKIVNRWGKRYRLELSCDDGLKSTAAEIAEFDSDVEAEFAAAWKIADCGGWKLERESEILHAGQSVFTPDFTLVNDSGQRVLLEIIGYWTPEYLKYKTQQLEKFQQYDILLAVLEQTHFEVPSHCGKPIVFKRQLKPADVLTRLENRAE